MTRKEIEAWFSEWIDQNDLPAWDPELAPDLHLINDLGLDSLDQIELHMVAEEEFGIEAMDEEVESIQTTKDLINFIESKLKEKEV